MNYTIRAIKVCELDTMKPMVLRSQGFSVKDGTVVVEREKLYNYVFLIHNEQRRILVDTGLRDIGYMNGPNMEQFKGAMLWKENVDIEDALKSNGIAAGDVDWVILTHFHYDHSSNLDRFPNARISFHREAWINLVCPPYDLGPFYPKYITKYILDNWDRVVVTENDKEFLPGISMHWHGGHDRGCSSVSIKSCDKRYILASDVVQVYENLNIPVGVNNSVHECLLAMQWLKLQDAVIIPSHDPEILRKFPEGVVCRGKEE